MEKLLIIRNDRIGDFIIFTATFEAYSNLYLGYDIDLICDKSVYDLAKNVPLFKKVIPIDFSKLFDYHNLFYSTYLMSRLKLMKYDIIIYPVYSRNKKGDYLVNMIKAKEKICFDGNSSCDFLNERFNRNAIYTKIINSNKDNIPEIQRNAEFVEALGGKIESLKTKIWFSRQDIDKYKEIVNESRLYFHKAIVYKNYICFFPGAGKHIRLWDTNKWVELLKMLRQKYLDDTFVFLGSGEDEVVINDILENSPYEVNFLRMQNLCNKTTLPVMAKLIENARLLVSMETSAVHIAAAVGTPNVCIMGGGHFERFYPYGNLSKNKVVFNKIDCYFCDWNCTKNKSICIQNITSMQVFNEVLKLNL